MSTQLYTQTLRTQQFFFNWNFLRHISAFVPLSRGILSERPWAVSLFVRNTGVRLPIGCMFHCAVLLFCWPLDASKWPGFASVRLILSRPTVSSCGYILYTAGSRGSSVSIVTGLRCRLQAHRGKIPAGGMHVSLLDGPQTGSVA